MDFLGIGPLEILLILILGFLFFGPEKLPGMAAKAGKWYRNFSRAANNFTKSLNEEIEQETKQIKIDNDNTKSLTAPLQESAENKNNNESKPQN
jgi:sec-independent protein translocase protein TatB